MREQRATTTRQSRRPWRSCMRGNGGHRGPFGRSACARSWTKEAHGHNHCSGRRRQRCHSCRVPQLPPHARRSPPPVGMSCISHCPHGPAGVDASRTKPLVANDHTARSERSLVRRDPRTGDATEVSRPGRGRTMKSNTPLPHALSGRQQLTGLLPHARCMWQCARQLLPHVVYMWQDVSRRAKRAVSVT